jgi:drug/metabolite transporter (DMT)-like permease
VADSWRQWAAFTYVGVIGGGLAFALFFHGLAIATPTSAAFWRDTMVLWVALGAVAFLRERIKWWNVAAIGLLVIGEIVVSGGVGPLGSSRGEMFVLAATMLWAIEVVVVKSLLRAVSPATVSSVRMVVGSISLVAYLSVSGGAHQLVNLTGPQLQWALWTGGLLALYVATWMTALARARALDVTSVLVGSAVVTWLLQLIAGTATPVASSLGLILIVVGVALVAWLSLHRLIDRPRNHLT